MTIRVVVWIFFPYIFGLRENFGNIRKAPWKWGDLLSDPLTKRKVFPTGWAESMSGIGLTDWLTTLSVRHHFQDGQYLYAYDSLI